MLIEVKCFGMITAEEADKEAGDQIWLEHLVEIIATFPDCPTCAAPPQPLRSDIRRRVEMFDRLGVLLVTWDITCRCSTRLRYEGYEGGLPPVLVTVCINDHRQIRDPWPH
jgi:hypothetical protein